MRVTDVNARVLAACAGLLFAAPALAQSPGYPDRPVKMIIPFAAAGPTDVVARLIALKLSEKLGQQFYIENMAGAGGNLGMGAAARAPADGYTILFVSSSYTVNPSLYAKPPYDPDKDFVPVTKAAGSPNGLFVHPSIPAKSVKELVELIKANPGKYTSPPRVSAPRQVFRASYSSSPSDWISRLRRSRAAVRRYSRSWPGTRRCASRRFLPRPRW